jgi:hypothetical protein
MANRLFNQFIRTFLKEEVHLHARVTFGSSGAPTLDAVNSKGIKSVTRTSAGVFVFTFGTPSINTDIYPRWVNLVTCPVLAAASFPAATTCQVTATTTSTVTVQFSGPTSSSVTTLAATDPASGEEWRFEFILNNSTAQ